MQPLTLNELKGMRETVGSVMTTPVEVWRRATVSDPGGGQTDTWSKAHDYKCLYYGNAGKERLTTSGIIETIADFSFTFAYDADIHQQDRLKFDGRTFEVVTVGGATNEIDTDLNVSANEIT